MKSKRAEPSSGEVFLSFSGEDIRGELYFLQRDLEEAGIVVFKGDKSLRGGEEINQALKDVIKRSSISIAIISKHYAFSESCLMELVQMWECSQSDGQTIIPVFYDVTPDEVKNLAGAFAKSFKTHKANKKIHKNTINKWKEVLQWVGGLSGYELKKMDGSERHETPLLERVLKRVRQLLRKDEQAVTDKLVGIDLHVQGVMRKLGVVYSDGQAIKVCGEDIRVVGICGMRGVGKTTLAKVVYNKMHALFDGSCFLEDINSRGVMSSQETLIDSLQKRNVEPLISSDIGEIASLWSNVRVLIVLDNVHNDKQIGALAGKLSWFAPGSRIIVTTARRIVTTARRTRRRIVTTTRRNVLNVFDDGAVEEYKLEPLRDYHALQLFYKHAFQGGAPPDAPEYVSLSRDIVKALGGIPMAIEFWAENLKKLRNIEMWRNTWDTLNNHPEKRDVEAAFKTSYDYLDDSTKEIFLDIACFFIGKDERIPSYMWEACDYHPLNGLELLRNFYLLEDGETNELRMHTLIREFGRDMVKKKKSSKRCRFWNHSDVRPILDICAHPESGPSIGDSVKGIDLTFEEGCTGSFECEQFWKMSNLRYLRLDRVKIEGDTAKLPRHLRWLGWRECHLIPKLDNMQLEELVILDLSWSPVTKDSKFWRQISEKAMKLKVLNLQGCVELQSLESPAPIKLEILILEGCTRLIKIRPFISNLENLSSLNLRKCWLVTELPAELYSMEFLRELLIDETGIERIDIQKGSFKNLETLSACGCKKLEYVSAIGHLMELKSLALDGAPIDWHEETYEFPHKLRRLSLRECRMFDELPPSIENLRLLEEMDLSYTGITEMPPSVKHLSNLKKLKMEGTYLEKFPEDIVKLEKLEEIDFSRCKSMKGRDSCDLSGLFSLRILRLASSNVAGLPGSICHLSGLETLDVSKCKQLQELPELPCSLFSLCWGSKIMAVPNSTNLKNLKELSLIHDEWPEAGSSNQTPDIGWITELTSLETLELSLPNVTNLPGNLSALSQLRKLTLSHMKELDLAQLPSPSTLWTLCLKHCKIRVPKVSGLNLLSELELKECDLAEIDGLEDLTLLEVLIISPCSRITDLNGLKKLRRLRKVKVHPFEFDPATLSKLRKRGCEVGTCGSSQLVEADEHKDGVDAAIESMEELEDESGQPPIDVETSDRNYAIAAAQNVVGIDDHAKQITTLLEMEVDDESMEKMKDEAGQRPEDMETSDRNYAIAAVRNIVGIDGCVKQITDLLEMEVNDEVRILGIYGTDGIGKTTLAKAVYDCISCCFDSRSFLTEVDETAQDCRGVRILQTRLVRDILEQDREDPSFDERIEDFLDIFRERKVLLVVDGVEGKSHLRAIVGDQLHWFGPGSRIIVTSQNEEILKDYDPEKARTYPVSALEDGQAFELFCMHAFRMQSSIPDYDGLANRIVKAAEKLPLAVEVVGSFLRGKSIQEWAKMEKSMKERTRSSRKTTVGPEEILDICCKELDQQQKDIFLDIACFISGVDTRIASYMWPNCYLPSSGCILMPLAKTGENNELQMHRLLRCLGKRICKRGESQDPRSRRFCTQDMVLKAMNREKGMGSVEVDFTAGDFQSMPKLRFLKLDNARVSGNFTGAFASLKWLCWQRCPPEFDAENLELRELAILELPWGKITEDWGGWSKIKMPKLKVLNLTGCSDLLFTPNFSRYEDLEILILEGCYGLVKLDPSIGHLKRLVSLNLKSCSQLNVLPVELGDLTALEELFIDGTSVPEIPISIGNLKKLEILSGFECSPLTHLPRSIIYLTALSELSFDSAEITELPSSLGDLLKLRRLSLRNCCYLEELPDSIGRMGSLEELNITGTRIAELPRSIGNMESLKVLRMDSSFIRAFPGEIGNLANLEELHASWCRSLKGALPSDIEGLHRLRSLTLGHSRISSLPPEFSTIPGLHNLDLIQCNEIIELPKLSPSLIRLRVSSKRMKAIVLEDLNELEELCLSDGDPKARRPPSAIEEIEGLEGLKALKRLDISNCRIRNLDGIGQLTSLRSFDSIRL